MRKDSLLNKVKKSLLIPEAEDFADEEIKTLIRSGLDLISSTGVSKDVLRRNETVQSLVIMYAKTFFGFKSDGSVRELPTSFYTILNQLAISKGE